MLGVSAWLPLCSPSCPHLPPVSAVLASQAALTHLILNFELPFSLPPRTLDPGVQARAHHTPVHRGGPRPRSLSSAPAGPRCTRQCQPRWTRCTARGLPWGTQPVPRCCCSMAQTRTCPAQRAWRPCTCAAPQPRSGKDFQAPGSVLNTGPQISPDPGFALGTTSVSVSETDLVPLPGQGQGHPTAATTPYPPGRAISPSLGAGGTTPW